MDAALHIGCVQNKKHLKNMTKALCEIMECAHASERSDETTRAAIRALTEAAEVRNVNVSNCNFNGTGTAMTVDPVTPAGGFTPKESDYGLEA